METARSSQLQGIRPGIEGWAGDAVVARNRVAEDDEFGVPRVFNIE